MHGLGNYKAMRTDPELPFSDKIKRSASLSYRASYQAFVVAASAVKKVFDDALEAGRVKAELEVQAAVAAAAKAASKREEDAALLREGGDGVEDVIRNMPETQVENAFEFDGTDSHFVTLKRLHSNVRETLAKEAGQLLSPDVLPEEFNEGTIGRPRAEGATGRPRSQMMLSMPDARILDLRLMDLLAEVEGSQRQSGPLPESESVQTETETQAAMMRSLRKAVLSRFHGERLNYYLREYTGVGLAGAQCGTTHRTLNDGTDFAYGSASPPLSQVAYGTDAPRYLRALGIPMNVTRFAVSALSYADKNCVDQLLSLEHRRFYGSDQEEESEKSATDSSPAETLAASDGEKQVPQRPNLDADSPKSKQKEASRNSENAVATKPLDPSVLVDKAFRDEPKVRAVICLGVLMFGFPCAEAAASTISPDVIALTKSETGTDMTVFDINRFRESLLSFSDDVTLPDASSIAEYVQATLLPHCLRLCLYGNGPSTRDARGSEGKFETALGVSLHSTPAIDSPCPLPDPCLELNVHSLESLGVACAILRRTQLLRAAQFLCGSGTTTSTKAAEILAASKSKLMDFGDHLPVWWCPWVHDIGLLIRAASEGLFAVMENRSGDKIFSENAISEFLRTSLESQPFPFVDHFSSPEILEEWISCEAQKFPTLLQVERRLAFLCSKASSAAARREDRFVVLPMFDHGGWPRD